ncbi:response regulator [Euzebyella marina]|uniref:histidine kinase n=1 Tax=Euzebyella marina TaxID=1761453 RepID=A0A3G2L126_9FLAO|nr:ATP-binding protein [Euzebyella marina]AYN65949.1 response regulator [Euzebyella marina]
MLKRYKEEFHGRKFQFILTDLKGVVLESDQHLLAVKEKELIGDVHPFFFSLPEIMQGDERTTSFHCVQLGDRTGELTTDITVEKVDKRLLVIIENLTDHYLSYQSIAQSRNESIIDSELILLKNHELQERERFKNEFIQNFSHELRNPLTNIIALTNILQRSNLNEEQTGILEVLKGSTSNLKLMLEDILSLAMISKGKLALNPTVFNFRQFIEFIRLTYTTRAQEKGLAFALTADEKIPEYIEGDRLRMLQIVTNLCDNAIKYTEKGKVALYIALNQKRANTINLRFGVKDTGQGIPEEKLETVLESFEQLGKSEGAGLGLAIVKGLLALMNAQIKIQSIENEGSHFYFDVTLKYPLHHQSTLLTSKHAVTHTSPKISKTPKKFKVLLVEDNEHVQTSLLKTLIDTGDFFIDLVGDGALVMQEIVNKHYDIVLMDVNLPNITGDQLAKVIRGLPFKNIKKIPIIGITANSYKEQIKAYKKAGMNIVLSKPFDDVELIKTMYKLLR